MPRLENHLRDAVEAVCNFYHDFYLGRLRGYDDKVIAVLPALTLWSPNFMSDAVPWCLLQSILAAVGLLFVAVFLSQNYNKVKSTGQEVRQMLKTAMVPIRVFLDGRMSAQAKRRVGKTADFLMDRKNLGVAAAVSLAALAMPVNYFWLFSAFFKTISFLVWCATSIVRLPLIILRYLVSNILTWPLGLVTYFCAYPIDYCLQVALGRILWIISFSLVKFNSASFGYVTQTVEATCDAVYIGIWPVLMGILCGAVFLVVRIYHWEANIREALVEGGIVGARAKEEDKEEDNDDVLKNEVADAFALVPRTLQDIKARLTHAEALNGRLQELISPLDGGPWKRAEILIDEDLIQQGRLALCVWRAEKSLRKAQLKDTPRERESALTGNALEVVTEAQSECYDLDTTSLVDCRMNALGAEVSIAIAEARCGPPVCSPDWTKYEHGHPAKWELADEELEKEKLDSAPHGTYEPSWHPAFLRVKSACLAARIRLHTDPEGREWEDMLTDGVVEEIIGSVEDSELETELRVMAGLELARAYAHVKEFDEAIAAFEKTLRCDDVSAAREEKKIIEDAKEDDAVEETRRALASQLKDLQKSNGSNWSQARALLTFLKDHDQFSFCVKLEQDAIDLMDGKDLAVALFKSFKKLHPDLHVGKPKEFKVLVTELAKTLSALKDELQDELQP